MNRKLLLRIPVLGPYLERRWMPDPVERDTHCEIVRERLEAPAPRVVPVEQDLSRERDLPPQLTGDTPED